MVCVYAVVFVQEVKGFGNTITYSVELYYPQNKYVHQVKDQKILLFYILSSEFLLFFVSFIKYCRFSLIVTATLILPSNHLFICVIVNLSAPLHTAQVFFASVSCIFFIYQETLPCIITHIITLSSVPLFLNFESP